MRAWPTSAGPAQFGVGGTENLNIFCACDGPPFFFWRGPSNGIKRVDPVINSAVLLSPECAAHSGDNTIRLFWKVAYFGLKSQQRTPFSENFQIANKIEQVPLIYRFA